MTDLTGPWDEIGFVSESGVNEAKVGDHIVAQREDGRLIFGKVVEIVPQDTPVKGQEHLRSPDIEVPIGTVENGRMYRGLSPDGRPVWIRYEPEVEEWPEADPELADMIPRTKPRRSAAQVIADDERREAEAKAEAARWKSPDPLTVLAARMEKTIWTDMLYEHPAQAQKVLEDVIAELRANSTLSEAWSDGFAAGADYLSSCCGCSGRGEPPANPYGEV